jgi:nitrogen fixation protein FixH
MMKIEKDAVRLFDKLLNGILSFFGIVIFANILLMIGAQIINYLIR